MAWFDECVVCRRIWRGRTPGQPLVCPLNHPTTRQLNPTSPGDAVGLPLADLLPHIHGAGLEFAPDSPEGWWRVGDLQGPHMYLERRRGHQPVRLFHLSKFVLQHPSCAQLSVLAARELHVTNVTGVVRFTRPVEPALQALQEALGLVAAA